MDERANRRSPSGYSDSYREPRVYRGAMEAAMRVFDLTKTFPAEERYATAKPAQRRVG